jgi:hypothetical protein
MNFELAHTLEILNRTPATLERLLDGLSDDWVLPNEGPDTWSPYDIIGHLIEGEESNWIPRVRTILEHGEEQAFKPFDRFAQFEKSKGKSLHELLEEFARMRQASLSELQRLNLTPADMEKRGQHPAFGPVTLAQVLATWTIHDLSHIAQIARVMCRQYGEAVGPWKEYLPILQR